MAMSVFEESHYQDYVEKGFTSRWLRPELLYSKIDRLKDREAISIEELGKSIEGRPIYSIKYGKGSTKIVAWSQMHGNEPTATMAVMDLLNFLTTDDQYDPLRQKIQKSLSITFIPMLNPDGAERFTRRNALNIDLNRDAASHSMPELKLLLDWVAQHQPDWAFNLHDQRNIFTVGDTDKSATISFLAASADREKIITPTRLKSMNLISLLSEVVERELPGHVAKYTDEFYPRALGEYFHKNEIPCVLVESGAYQGDPLRKLARKMNFLCLVEALTKIADDKVPEHEVQSYHQIPANTTNMLDLIVRDCTLHFKGSTYKADVGFLIKETLNKKSNSINQLFVLQDIGDLNFHYGFKERRGGELKVEDNSIELDQPADMHIQFIDGEDLVIKEGALISG